MRLPLGYDWVQSRDVLAPDGQLVELQLMVHLHALKEVDEIAFEIAELLLLVVDLATEAVTAARKAAAADGGNRVVSPK
jgi:hypothetical protein